MRNFTKIMETSKFILGCTVPVVVLVLLFVRLYKRIVILIIGFVLLIVMGSTPLAIGEPDSVSRMVYQHESDFSQKGGRGYDCESNCLPEASGR